MRCAQGPASRLPWAELIVEPGRNIMAGGAGKSMNVQDDFGQWERELRRTRVGPGVPWGLIAAVTLVPAGCGIVIALGETALGVCAFVICVVILVLWRAGM